jgi:hypothetical protein
MVDLATISLALQTISVMSVATAAIIGLRSYINSNKRAEESKRREIETRELDIYMQLVRQTRTPEFMKQWSKVRNLDFKDNEDFFRKYGHDVDPESFSAYLTVVQTYNCIAMLVRKDVLTMETLSSLVVFEAFKGVWRKAERQMVGWSEEYGYYPWEDLRWLIGEIDKYIANLKLNPAA